MILRLNNFLTCAKVVSQVDYRISFLILDDNQILQEDIFIIAEVEQLLEPEERAILQQNVTPNLEKISTDGKTALDLSFCYGKDFKSYELAKLLKTVPADSCL
ncbi:hypothetical protein V8G54_031714 [Vigna mungo]|uniref:Uncharacterized protein n=1 Tax=Vigna mungo TaxID=3915 RepID=A0AAQ3MK10_VIGMU